EGDEGVRDGALAGRVEDVEGADVVQAEREVVLESPLDFFADLPFVRSRPGEEGRRRRGLRALDPLGVVVRDLRGLLGPLQDLGERLEGPGDGADAHRRAVAPAVVRAGLLGLRPTLEVASEAGPRIAPVVVFQEPRQVPAVEQPIGDGRGEHRVVREAGLGREQGLEVGRPLQQPPLLALVHRADDVARDRAQHAASGSAALLACRGTEAHPGPGDELDGPAGRRRPALARRGVASDGAGDLAGRENGTLVTPSADRLITRNPVRWLDRQQQALAEISRLWRAYQGDLERTIRGVTEATSSALGIARVSFWRYNRAKRTILCEDLYESASNRHTSGMRLQAERNPAYFKALESEEVIAAADARDDPRTCEFSASYLGPLGIGAMLDAPVRVDGRLAGVLCLEHVGGVREFRDDEIRMTTYLADMIGAFLTVGDWCGGQTGRGRAFGQLLAAGEKLEELIRDEMAVWRILFEQSRDGIVVLDREGRVVAANRMYSQLLGYSEDEIHELSVWDWDLVYEQEQVREMLRSVNESGDHFESRHRRKDGTVIDVEISTNGALFKDRKLIFCFVRDVTERKRVEEQLRVLATTVGITGLANRI
ncbi:hypothetical protein HK102_009823, partial [Quaeritorhiza haematococci]